MQIETAFILYHDHPDSIKYMEDCRASCIQHGIPVIPFKWYSISSVTTQQVRDEWGFRIDPRCDHYEDNPQMKVWFKEQLCLTGHMAIWKQATFYKNAIAVFEHDAIVKRNFLDVEVNDYEWMFLGYRVDHRDDYECIDDPFTYHNVKKFEGTHAYAMTPNTARHVLGALDAFDKNRGYLPLGVSVDHMMGVDNGFNLPLKVVDPAPVVAAIENRDSHTQPDGKVARYNMIPHAGFMKGLIKNIHKYGIDDKNGWLTF